MAPFAGDPSGRCRLAALLKERFTVIHYARRGRGDSGGGGVYDVQREIENLQAVADTVGGEPFVYGISSGAVLAARSVAGGVKARKLALYEPPLALDGTHQPHPLDFIEQIEKHLALAAAGKP
jgi:alpha-beta hydrolase superfamily lysophospholipase